MVREISLDEVKQHKDSKSVWMVIHNDVYDVTSFLEEHPGGEETLLEVAGEDGTQAFEDVGHSEDARELLKKFKIGTLPATEVHNVAVPTTQNVDKGCSRDTTPKSNKTWRTYDQSPRSKSRTPSKHSLRKPNSPKPEKRIDKIVVPSDRKGGKGTVPCDSGDENVSSDSSNLKWALLALAGAIVIGIALKKYMSQTSS